MRMMAFGFSIINILVFIGVLACSIYGFVLFVRFAKRGIKALDLYIYQFEKRDYQEQNREKIDIEQK